MPPPDANRFLKGHTALVAAVVLVVILAAAFPAYRWFLFISIAIGCLVAAILWLWHKLHPLQEKDVENKRPLGLS